MNIKCPNCQTAYVVPDGKVGNKPKKMRCSRCNEVFTVKRRNEKTPGGYQEFTGRHESLPREFAFLKAKDGTEEKMPFARISSPPAAPARDISNFESFAPPSDDAKSTQPGFGAGNVRVTPVQDRGPRTKERLETDDNQVIPKQRSQETSASPPVGPPPPPTQSNSSSKPQTTEHPPPPINDEDQTVPMTTHKGSSLDIYGATSWETEAPLDLGSYAAPFAVSYAAPSEQSQKIGKIMASFTVAFMLLILFVVYRNGWTLSLSNSPEQFAFAFSGAAREVLPDEVRDLEAVISNERILSSGSKTYLIVKGTLFNNAPVKRTNIMLRARLYDTSDELRAEVKAPCNVIVEDPDIKRTPQGQIDQYYSKHGNPVNCTVKQESSTLYQLIFETPPLDYNPGFKVEVTPIFAR